MPCGGEGAIIALRHPLVVVVIGVSLDILHAATSSAFWARRAAIKASCCTISAAQVRAPPVAHGSSPAPFGCRAAARARIAPAIRCPRCLSMRSINPLRSWASATSGNPPARHKLGLFCQSVVYDLLTLVFQMGYLGAEFFDPDAPVVQFFSGAHARSLAVAVRWRGRRGHDEIQSADYGRLPPVCPFRRSNRYLANGFSAAFSLAFSASSSSSRS